MGGVPSSVTADQLAEMRRLWETEPGLSARDIGARFGVSRNAVIGHANRRGWPPRRAVGPKPTTIFTRLAALHAGIDAVLAATRPHVEDRKPVMVRAWAEDDPRRLKQAFRLRKLGGNLRQRGVG